MCTIIYSTKHKRNLAGATEYMHRCAPDFISCLMKIRMYTIYSITHKQIFAGAICAQLQNFFPRKVATLWVLLGRKDGALIE